MKGERDKNNNYMGNEIEGDLLSAARMGDIELFSTLLRSGADINITTADRGLTSLHIACEQGDKELVETILAYHRETGRVDFTIKTSVKPRLAWQLAMNAGFYDIANQVDEFAHGTKQFPQP